MRTRWLVFLGFCSFFGCGCAGSPAPTKSSGVEQRRRRERYQRSEIRGRAEDRPRLTARRGLRGSPSVRGEPHQSERRRRSRAIDHAEAPGTTDARARYSRANVQLSEARRQVEIATSQRDCANACRALDSMERAAAQLCELARSNDERRTCKSAEEQVGSARDRVHSACGDCPKKTR